MTSSFSLACFFPFFILCFLAVLRAAPVWASALLLSLLFFLLPFLVTSLSYALQCSVPTPVFPGGEGSEERRSRLGSLGPEEGTAGVPGPGVRPIGQPL